MAKNKKNSCSRQLSLFLLDIVVIGQDVPHVFTPLHVSVMNYNVGGMVSIPGIYTLFMLNTIYVYVKIFNITALKRSFTGFGLYS